MNLIDCDIYSGAWGALAVGDGCALIGLEDGEYNEFEDPDDDLKTLQAGVSLAFIFGLFAVVAKTGAYSGSDGAKKNMLGAALLCSAVAVLGAAMSFFQVS